MQQSASSSSVSSAQAASNNNKPADYVYFERTTAGFSEDALPRSKAAQLKLEHYYKVAVESAIERNQRYVISPFSSCSPASPPLKTGRAREEARRGHDHVRGA